VVGFETTHEDKVRVLLEEGMRLAELTADLQLEASHGNNDRFESSF